MNELYYAGVGAGLVYLAGDLVGGLITPRYSPIKNAVSELIQSGARHRTLLSMFMFVHALLIIMFALALMLAHPPRVSSALYYGGVMLLVVGVCHALSSSIFPMDPVGEKSTLPGKLHLVLVGISVLAIIAAMPLIASGYSVLYDSGAFKPFTYISLGILLVSGLSSPIIIAKKVPLMGLTERITGYVFYVWLGVLAVGLG